MLEYFSISRAHPINHCETVISCTNYVWSSVGAFKEDCDYSKGKWVWDTERNIYNSSEWICPTRPTGYNCEMNGKDLEYLNWRWKPDGCELPKFEPYSFLNIIRGKTLAFVGDSLSLNQLNSLLCLVSQVCLLFFFCCHI